MSTTDRETHWENVYTTKAETEVSWFQETPAPSLDLLGLTGAKSLTAIIDIGGGVSRLVDSLLAKGFENVTVLDLSAAALASARARLGRKGTRVKWILADATNWQPSEIYDVWHDRAAFHFLTGEREQNAYIRHLKHALRVGGHVIIGTFALDGPEKCSGLPVARHSAESLAALLGTDFALVDSRRHEHSTPMERDAEVSVQHFPACRINQRFWSVRFDRLGPGIAELSRFNELIPPLIPPLISPLISSRLFSVPAFLRQLSSREPVLRPCDLARCLRPKRSVGQNSSEQQSDNQPSNQKLRDIHWVTDRVRFADGV
jgi:SAM-dependent methyltransferase